MITVLGMLAVSLCEPLVPALLQPLLDQGFAPGGINLWLIPTAIIGIFLVRGVGSFCSQYALAKIANTGILSLRLQLFEKLQQTQPRFFEVESASSINNTMTHDVQNGAGLLVNSVLTVGRDSLTLVTLLAYLFYLNWQLMLVVLLLFPILYGVISLTSRRLGRLNQESLAALDQLSYTVEENVLAYQVIRLQGAEKQQQERYRAIATRVMNLLMKTATASAAITPLTQILTAVSLSIVISFALIQSGEQGYTVGSFAAFITGMLMLVSPIRHLSEIAGPITRGLTCLERAFDFLDNYPRESGGTIQVERVRGNIAFQSVCVSYPGQTQPALWQLDLSIAAGQTVAIVGASGSGKTSLVNLLPRWLSVSAGQVTIDGIPIEQFELTTLRRQFAMVSQNVVVLNDSLLHNVCLGHPPDRLRAQSCLLSANLGDWLSQLPQGMDTLVGHNASQLSGGQRQRLAIARAMYKNAPILILDEATSALDHESERQVQDALASLCVGRTTLIIAHRLSTIEYADRIVVLEQGRLIEQGNHTELLRRQGAYWNFVQLGDRIDKHRPT